MNQTKELFFPQSFPFFHFGMVESAQDIAFPLKTAELIVLFQLISDELGHCIVAFKKLPSPPADYESMAIELANILASKYATQLADQLNIPVQISPPHVLTINKNILAFQAQQISNKYYKFIFEGKEILFAMTYMPSFIAST